MMVASSSGAGAAVFKAFSSSVVDHTGVSVIAPSRLAAWIVILLSPPDGPGGPLGHVCRS